MSMPSARPSSARPGPLAAAATAAALLRAAPSEAPGSQLLLRPDEADLEAVDNADLEDEEDDSALGSSIESVGAEDCASNGWDWKKYLRRHSCFIAAGLLIATFIVLGCKVEGWNIVTCIYVLMQIVTTIGYGDVTPTTATMKLFLCVYVLLILATVAFYINRFVQRLVTRSVDLFGHYVSYQIKHLDSHNHHPDEDAPYHRQYRRNLAWATFNLVAVTITGALFFGIMEPCTCSYGVSSRCSSFDRHEECVKAGGYRKTWVDCIYLSVITVTTVGFGDYTPKSKEGRIFAIIWCFVGVACCFRWLSCVTVYFFESHRLQSFDLKHMFLDEDVFREMDTQQNGVLTRHEYLSYVLVKQGLVSSEVLQQVNTLFDRIDPDQTNVVTFEQLLRLQQKRAERTARKLDAKPWGGWGS